MHAESTTVALFLTPEEAARRLGVSLDFLSVLADAELVARVYVRSQARYKASSIQAVAQDRSAILDHWERHLIQTWTTGLTQRSWLYSAEIAKLFGVSPVEARAFFGRFPGGKIPKAEVWKRIAAGSAQGQSDRDAFAAQIQGVKRGRQKPIPTATRLAVRQRDRDCCRYCGEPLKMPGIHIDHVIPRVQGGSDLPSNLVVACYGCNIKKGRKSLAEVGMSLIRLSRIRKQAS